jgi:hypothetical protein
VAFFDLSDRDLFEFLCVLIVLLAGSYTIYFVARRLGRSREGLLIAVPLFVGFALRLAAAASVNQLSIARTLRGGDELGFVGHAKVVAGLPLAGPESIDKLVSSLHTFVFSINFRVFGVIAPESMLRIEMILFAVLGIAFLSAAVYELAGPRPAVIVAWILALEPANIFFSSLLHKEPLMYLAEGMVAFGGAVLWKRGKVIALIPMIVGCLIAMATRPYAGWFLTAAAAAVVLHASLTRQRGIRSIAITGGMVVLIALFIPVVWNASSDENLKELQQSQDFNAADDTANLSLERVDYATREKLIINLPKRIKDVIFRPYVWQAENPSQQLGVIGTLVVLACLALLAMAIARNRKQIMRVAGPLVYPAGFMLVAYAISAGNAGTAYRYRTHLVGLAVCLVIVLLAHRRQEQEGLSRVPKRPGLATVSRTRTAT